MDKIYNSFYKDLIEPSLKVTATIASIIIFAYLIS